MSKAVELRYWITNKDRTQFWSSDGWGPFEKARTYTVEEVQQTELPEGGLWYCRAGKKENPPAPPPVPPSRHRYVMRLDDESIQVWAEISALVCECEGMRAENEYRKQTGRTVAYADMEFFDRAERIRALAASYKEPKQ